MKSIIYIIQSKYNYNFLFVKKLITVYSYIQRESREKERKEQKDRQFQTFIITLDKLPLYINIPHILFQKGKREAQGGGKHTGKGNGLRRIGWGKGLVKGEELICREIQLFTYLTDCWRHHGQNGHRPGFIYTDQ